MRYDLSHRGPRWCAALLTLATLAVAPAHAQAVLGFGDDATTVPAGAARLGFENMWARWDWRYQAPTGASIITESQTRRTPISLALGVTSRLELRLEAPSVGTQVTATYFPDTATAIHADSQETFAMSAIGDARGSLKFVWLRTLRDSARYHPRGIHVQSALTATEVIGTGNPGRPGAQFGIGTGTGASAIEVGSQWDLLAGHMFWMSVVGRYGHPFADTRVVSLAPPNNPFAATGNTAEVTRHLGNYYEIETTPRFTLGEYFLVGAQYRYRHEAQTQFAALGPAGAPSSAGTDVTEQRVGLGAVYSSAAAHAEGHGALPFEITLQYFRVVQITGSRPKPGEYVIGVRFYGQLWGHSLRQPGR